MDWHYRTWHCQPLLFLATLLSTCYFSCELDDWKYQSVMRENGLASFDSIPTAHLLNTCKCIPPVSVIIFKGERSPTISSDPATICYPSSFLWYLAVVSQVKQWILFHPKRPRFVGNLRKKKQPLITFTWIWCWFQSDFLHFLDIPIYLKQWINFQKKTWQSPTTNQSYIQTPTNQWQPMASRLQAASLGYQFRPLQTQARWIQQVRNVWGNPVALASASGKTIKEKAIFTPEV